MQADRLHGPADRPGSGDDAPGVRRESGPRTVEGDHETGLGRPEGYPESFDVADFPVGDCPAGLYDHTGIADGVDGWEAADGNRYLADGFLLVRSAFPPGLLAPAAHALSDLVAAGARGVQFEFGTRARALAAPPEERMSLVRKVHSFAGADPRLDAVMWHPPLIEWVGRLLGEPPAPEQEMALLKPPGGREKPWHQDHAYFDVPLSARVVGAWIALDEATIENGCMHVMPRAHHGGPIPHFRVRDWQICDSEVPARIVLAVPMRPGDCLLFDSMTPHGTPPNTSPRGRRALQFHYRASSVAKVPSAQRLAVFGGEGLGATC